MRDYTKSRKNQNINFRVAKESEQMLIKDGVSTSGRVKEGCVEVAVCKKYCDAGSKDREGQKKQNGSD